MDIIHNISFHSNEEARRRIEEIGIKFETYVNTFTILESDKKWPEVKKNNRFI